MKKLFYFIFPFVICLFSFVDVKATGFALSPSTLNSLSSGAESLQYLSYAQNGVVPMSGVSSDTLNDLLNEHTQKSTRYTITAEDITSVVNIEDAPYEIVSAFNDMEFVYNGGEPLLLADRGNCRYCTFDNGYYSGYCIVASSGDLIYQDVTGYTEKPIAGIRIGGSELSYNDYMKGVSDSVDTISDNNFSFASDGSAVNSSYYLFYGINKQSAESLYISNMFLPGQIVPTNTSTNTIISSWYTNDLTLFNHNVIQGTSIDYTITEGQFSKNGYNYRYRVSFGTRGQSINTLISYSNWDNTNILNPCFGRTNTTYTSEMQAYENMSITTFLPTEGELEGDLSFAVSLGEAMDIAGTVSGLIPYPNVVYDPSLPISDTNKLVVVPMDIAIDETPVIPVPDEDEEDIVIDIPQTIPITIPDDTNFEVPIISGLQSKFPFSIPWDIKNMLKGLRSVRKAPKIEISWYIRPIDYTWNFSLDLTPFDGTAELFRTCFLISFIIGLCVFSYSHFFGS